MFDLEDLQGVVARHGTVARIVVAAVAGSAPREIGAAMLVWDSGQSGTIGGGALEWQAIQTARGMLASGGNRLDRLPLGPNMGQCCGGVVSLLIEVYDVDSLARRFENGVFARAVDGSPMPLAVNRLLARARDQGRLPQPGLIQGWMVEPVTRPVRALWVWGAGHVGRAIVGVMAPLPGVSITWVDVAPDRFPTDIPGGVTALPAAEPGLLVAHAPVSADHLVLTYSHLLDLDLCHRLLAHGFSTLGLIGSATKWARFRSRLRALGHTESSICRIVCPIGDPSFGKHPQSIALGVATAFLQQRQQAQRGVAI
jgi:xanthine dehydrogenase accessory factor